MINVLFAAIIGGFALGMAAPNIQHFVAGCAAFARLQKVLDRYLASLRSGHMKIPWQLLKVIGQPQDHLPGYLVAV